MRLGTLVRGVSGFGLWFSFRRCGSGSLPARRVGALENWEETVCANECLVWSSRVFKDSRRGRVQFDGVDLISCRRGAASQESLGSRD